MNEENLIELGAITEETKGVMPGPTTECLVSGFSVFIPPTDERCQ